MLQSVLCIATDKYLMHVLVVLLHARFSVVSPIPFLLAAFFSSGHPYIGSTTILPDIHVHKHICTHTHTHEIMTPRMLLRCMRTRLKCYKLSTLLKRYFFCLCVSIV